MTTAEEWELEQHIKDALKQLREIEHPSDMHTAASFQAGAACHSLVLLDFLDKRTRYIVAMLEELKES